MLTNSIRYPGNWLVREREERFHLEGYIQITEYEIITAISSYCGYFQESEHYFQELYSKVLEKRASIFSTKSNDNKYITNPIFGDLSQEMLHNAISQRRLFIMARSFITSMHLSRRMIDYLTEKADEKDKASFAIAKFDQKYPSLKHVRDSIQHHDERVRGSSWKLKKPLNSIMVENITDTGYQTMLVDGTQGHIPINLEILNDLIDTFQEVINSYLWDGPPSTWPHKIPL